MTEERFVELATKEGMPERAARIWWERLANPCNPLGCSREEIPEAEVTYCAKLFGYTPQRGVS